MLPLIFLLSTKLATSGIDYDIKLFAPVQRYDDDEDHCRFDKEKANDVS